MDMCLVHLDQAVPHGLTTPSGSKGLLAREIAPALLPAQRTRPVAPVAKPGSFIKLTASRQSESLGKSGMQIYLILLLPHFEINYVFLFLRGPAYHTTGNPTDSYGTIDFLGGPHPNKAQFIRLGFDSRPDLILQLLTREWGLELPKLIISVHGGKANFELNSRLKKVLRKGLLRAAKTTGSWILTGGTNTGVTRHVGDALISERSPRLRGGRVVSIGIAPWGVVENRAGLVGRNKDVTYLSIDQPRSKFAVLNNRHAYFLLADNGTVGKFVINIFF